MAPRDLQVIGRELGAIQAQRDRYAGAPESSFAAGNPGDQYGNSAEAKAATVADYDRQIASLRAEIDSRLQYEASEQGQRQIAETQRGSAEQAYFNESNQVGRDVRYLTEEGFFKPTNGEIRLSQNDKGILEISQDRVINLGFTPPPAVNEALPVSSATPFGEQNFFITNSSLSSGVPTPIAPQDIRVMNFERSGIGEKYGITYGQYSTALENIRAGNDPYSSFFDPDASLYGVFASSQERLSDLTGGFIPSPTIGRLERRAASEAQLVEVSGNTLGKVEAVPKIVGFEVGSSSQAPNFVALSFVGGVAFGEAGALTSGVISQSPFLSGVARYAIENPMQTQALTATAFGVIPTGYSYLSSKLAGASEQQAFESGFQTAGRFALGYPAVTAGAQAARYLPQLGLPYAQVPVGEVQVVGGKPQQVPMQTVAKGLTLRYSVGPNGEPLLFGGEANPRVDRVLLGYGENTPFYRPQVGGIPYGDSPTLGTYYNTLLTQSGTVAGPYQFYPRGPFEVEVLTNPAGLAAQGIGGHEASALNAYLGSRAAAAGYDYPDLIKLPKQTKYASPEALDIAYKTIGNQQGGVERIQGSSVLREQLSPDAKSVYRLPKDVDIALRAGQEPRPYAATLTSELQKGGIDAVLGRDGQVLIGGQKAFEYIAPDSATQFIYGLPQQYAYGIQVPQSAAYGVTPRGETLPVQRASEQVGNFGITLFGFYRGTGGVQVGAQTERIKDVESLLGIYATSGAAKPREVQAISSYGRASGGSYPQMVTTGLGSALSVGPSAVVSFVPNAGDYFGSIAPAASSRGNPASTFIDSGYRPNSGSISSSLGPSYYSYGSSSSSSGSNYPSSSGGSSSNGGSSSSSFYYEPSYYSSSSSSSSSSSGSNSSSSSSFSSSSFSSYYDSSYVYGPAIPPMMGGGGAPSGGLFGFSFGGRATKYAPSVVALLGNIRGPQPGIITGFEVRPISGSSSRRRKRR